MASNEQTPDREAPPALQQISHTRLVDEAVRVLRQAIVTGQFKPGQRLPENQLAREMGISRTPLREAFRMLEEEGMVTVSRSRGVEVVRPDFDNMCDLYDVREVLDGLAARRAAANITDEQITELRQLLDDMRACLNEGDYHGWLQDNIQFHELIAQASGNTRLGRLQPTIQASVQMFHPTLVREGKRAWVALQEHEAIVAAIAARDPARAEETAREHIRSAKLVLERLFEREGQRV